MNAIGSTRRFLFVAALALLPTLVGCEKRVDQSEGTTDGNFVPLKASGLSSAGELRRDLSGLDAAELKKAYDWAFRRAFSSKVALRNYPEAIRMVNRIITERPAYAPAYRVLGYSLFNTGRASEALAAERSRERFVDAKRANLLKKCNSWYFRFLKRTKKKFFYKKKI